MDKIQSGGGRQWLKELTAGEAIDELFLISTASQQQAKNGPFWRLELQDASSSMEGRIWFPFSQQYTDLSAGTFVVVTGRAESFRDKLQINITDLRVLDAEESAAVDVSAFLPSSARAPQVMLDELESLCRKVLTHKPWRRFALSVLRDEGIRPRLLVMPAAKSVHHAWVGGLLEHTLSVITLCMRLCDHYPELDRQTLLVGALCHDLGKLWELSGGLSNEYTDEGRLIGHISLAMERLGRLIDKSGLEAPLAMHLRHLILSHHGLFEYGSPRVPQTAEALALHYADNLDAKLTQCRSLFTDVEAGETSWSSYQKTLDRQLFHAARTPEPEPKAGRERGTGEKDAEPDAASASDVPKVSQCSLL